MRVTSFSLPKACFGVVLLLSPFPAFAGIVTNSASLPPLVGSYVTMSGVHACFEAGLPFEVCISQGNHGSFTNIVNIWLPLGGELEFFDSVFTGEVTSPLFAVGPLAMTGLVGVEVYGRSGPSETGTFDTEMLQLSLTGLSPLGQVLIRESPTLPSLGRTTITDLGGGQYQIDSFFDVFTELSIDGGQTWVPSTGSARVELQPDVPEPSSQLLIVTAIALGANRFRRRRGLARAR